MPVAQSQGHAGKALVDRGRRDRAHRRGHRVRRAGGQPGRRRDQPRATTASTPASAEQHRRARSPTTAACRCSTRTSSAATGTIFVQHLGDDPDEGWVAFGAFDPDDPTCLVAIDREAEVLVNACDRAVTYPFDGEGLAPVPGGGRGRTDPRRRQRAHHVDHRRLVEPRQPARPSGPCRCRCGAARRRRRSGSGTLYAARCSGAPRRRGRPASSGGARRAAGTAAAGTSPMRSSGRPTTRGLEHVGVLLERLLDLEGVDAVAAVLDDVLAAALEHHHAERALAGQVAGAEPAVVGEHRRGRPPRRPSSP